MLRSTFLGFKTASSALKVNQNLLDVVGQNISNVNTEGYTRQRLDINSVSFNTGNLKHSSSGIIGQGVKINGISQYRDSFLDLRYRAEAAKIGTEGVKLDALSDLESVFDEISMDGLDAQISDLVEQLQVLSSSPSDPVIEGVVRTSASMLCQLFNNYSEQINTIKEQQTSYLKEGAIVKVNQLLKNIAVLNKQIKEDNVSGNFALELNDERNMMLDELSSYLDIEVVLTPMSIGAGKEIDILSVNLKENDMKLIDGSKHLELDAVSKEGNTEIVIKKNLDETLNDISDPSFNITDSITRGQISGYLKFLNGKGEFDSEDVSNERGLQYYEKMLDTLANKFAKVMNEANAISDDIQKPLFEARDGEEIRAGNIKVSEDWIDSSESYITNTKEDSSADNTGATDNILKIINLFQKDLDFSTGGTTDKELFKGTMQEFFSYTATNLSLQVEDLQKTYDTYSETQYQIDYLRSSMSSVDLDEEGVNLLTYSKSYNAAARLMTTLDEMLDTLINRMGV